MSFNKKVLCFTTSYNRPKMLRGCMLDISNQSYEKIFHVINITYDNQLKFNEGTMSKIFDDILTEKNSVSYSQNQHQHYNHLNEIRSVKNYEDFDLFLKIDDDDIYKKNYVKTIVDYFNTNDVDVVSSKLKYQLNGSSVYIGDYNNLGGNPENCDFKMPFTFAFNLKALKLIENLSNLYGFEDNMWRDTWCNKSIIHEIDNKENVIWNIHGKNTSTADFLKNN